MRAWTLRTPRLELACHDPSSADAYAEAVAGSRESLARFMSFALHEPDGRAYTELFVAFRERFTRGDYTFGMRARDDGRIVGGASLHPTVGPLGREGGYWITRSEVGQGFATEAVAALCHLAFVQEGVDRVELRIQTDNPGSLRVAEKAGFTREAVLRRRIPWPGEEPRDCVLYALFASDWPRSPCSTVPVEHLDASGRPLTTDPAHRLAR